MKKITALLLTSLLFFSLASVAVAAPHSAEGDQIILRVGQSGMYVNGVYQELDPGRDTVPVIRRSRTLLPISSVIQAFGGSVKWDGTTRQVTVELNGNVVELWIDNTAARVNGEDKTLDVAPIVLNGRTMVPLRFISDNLGAGLHWHGANGVISLFNYPKDAAHQFWFDGSSLGEPDAQSGTGTYIDGEGAYAVTYPLAWGDPYVVKNYYGAMGIETAYDYRTFFAEEQRFWITGDVERYEEETVEAYLENTGRVANLVEDAEIVDVTMVEEVDAYGGAERIFWVLNAASNLEVDSEFYSSELLFFKEGRVISLTFEASGTEEEVYGLLDALEEDLTLLVESFTFVE